ncbi:MAG: histidine phosphatase family protein [Henriciella sp.]|nr:histidine phosphatase family protein [Henriciella sp.]
MRVETLESQPGTAPVGTVERSHGRGQIIVSRHGRPALNRSVGPRLTWQQYVDWWQQYEAGSLAPDQQPKAALVQAVRDVDHVMSSTRPRAIETAKLATGGRDPEPDPIFDEAPLPPPTWGTRAFLPKTWNVLARTYWLFGHSLDGESVDEARERAKLAASRLHDAAEGQSVYLAAHGWFNRMLRRPLKHLGWICVRDGGDKYWSYRVYEYRGK